jgi:hypothetical protein
METRDQWNRRLDIDMRRCNETRVRLEEHDKAQQKELDSHKEELSELYDYKNDIYRKITENRANAATVLAHNRLKEQVAQLQTEKKFLPYVVMIISLIGTIISGIYITNKLTRGEHVGKSGNQNEAHERLPILRTPVSENSR